ncbi:hypothetical protein IMCC3317_20980 [Kordia antarctica]|uniref:Uncharacterized protein n=1 Tax=Kordia antarctica TaxID=1218801 RepID=A0A7L4ZJ11_9FLAO|nr:hypothetical protein [Kordia antarctica]QHI36728.1 hypothetical protein IMCC3317_20980 [Kordia antarctica]
MKNTIIIIISLFSIICFSQNKKPLYIKFDEKMEISNIIEDMTLSFHTINSDSRGNRYNFKVSNMGKDFNLRQFQEIKDSITEKEFKAINLTTIKELSKISPCDLHIMLSDLESIVLIKTVDNIHYKYRLVYWSTQRGWSTVKTN